MGGRGHAQHLLEGSRTGMSEGNEKAPRKHRVLTIVLAAFVALLLVVVVGGFLVYEHLNGNITSLDTTKALGTDRPSAFVPTTPTPQDRKSTRLNSSHPSISYAVFCLKKKNAKFDPANV